MKTILNKLIKSENLTEAEAFETLSGIALGQNSEAEIAALLMGIQQKGITVAELTGFRNAMLNVAIAVELNDQSAMDVCGTGGDGKNTFNISTTAAFVVAGAGQNIAKHGNHGLSSAVGSSTVLEALGIPFFKDSESLNNAVSQSGFCYMHAPLFHTAMKYVGPVRKALGIKTFFNILGPLLNPAKVKIQLSGVSDLNTFELYDAFFKSQNMKYGVLHSLDGYDEISLTGDFILATHQCRKTYSPADLSLKMWSPEELEGGESPEVAAHLIKNILAGNGTACHTEVVIANAAVALHISKELSILDAVKLAKESISSGKALSVLENLNLIKNT